MDGLRFFSIFLLGLLLLALAGCNSKTIHDSIWLNQGGTGGTPATTITIAGTGGVLFDGEGGQPPACCVSDPTSPFEGPSWFMFGEPGTLGPCPAPAAQGLTGYHEMSVEPHTCPACSCSPAPCTLPGGVHTNAAKCPGDASMALPLGPDAAAGWDGGCSDAGALPANLQCGAVPCIQSVTVPAVSVAPCEPSSGPAAPLPEPSWARMALECTLAPLPEESCEPGQVCLPGLPGDLTLCVHTNGDHPECPQDYPARTVFYMDVQDERGCDACQCSAPLGAQCVALFETFSDGACSTQAGAVVVTDQEAACVDVVSGTALGSAEASLLIDVPGGCTPSGGASFGAIHPAEPFTLCCQSDPEPPG